MTLSPALEVSRKGRFAWFEDSSLSACMQSRQA